MVGVCRGLPKLAARSGVLRIGSAKRPWGLLASAIGNWVGTLLGAGSTGTVGSSGLLAAKGEGLVSRRGPKPGTATVGELRRGKVGASVKAGGRGDAEAVTGGLKAVGTARGDGSIVGPRAGSTGGLTAEVEAMGLSCKEVVALIKGSAEVVMVVAGGPAAVSASEMETLLMLYCPALDARLGKA